MIVADQKAIEVGEGMEWGALPLKPETKILRTIVDLRRENEGLKKRVKDLENINSNLNVKNLELTVQNNNYKKIYDF